MASKDDGGGQLRGEGRLTKRVLRQKLRRGKGPVTNIAAGFTTAGRDLEPLRRGVR